ncbi:hypothetical protein [Clostridium formicaceticum]|uniref:Uncharacterized protein n=1 Tax=Clostridium formicaceticum TaxID=1497 RepID=A0AAC9WF96_9CLOT|nr:hypothetical protein [Clostridium formicaceticum]AOY76164.1 hypothetical protein BJL90_09770 [Clostridium formicaceticum]ARE86536.1 hypothetical protein CLFO_08580 [Clostridium formicaceticum]
MKKFNLFIVTFLIALIFSASITAVFATVAEGEKKDLTVNGTSYWNQSYIQLWGSKIVARSKVSLKSGSSLPVGYLGVLSRMYKDDGVLKTANAEWEYNSSPAFSYDVPTTYISDSGTYYSYGLTRIFNGSGYTQHTTNRSPSLKLD